MEKTANLTVFFQTKDPYRLIENLESTTTMISHTNAIQLENCSDYIILTTYHPTDIKKTLTKITAYPNTFINRAMYFDKTQSLENNEAIRTTIATAIINQFDNHHKTIYYQNKPVLSVSDYLKNKKFKNSIFVIQYDNKLYCDLYDQTNEKTYIFETKNLQEKETIHGKNS